MYNSSIVKLPKSTIVGLEQGERAEATGVTGREGAGWLRRPSVSTQRGARKAFYEVLSRGDDDEKDCGAVTASTCTTLVGRLQARQRKNLLEPRVRQT